MNRSVKIGIVIAGYVLAGIAALAAVFVNSLWMQAANAQASSGMSAFGDSLLCMLVFGTLALAPTLLAFYFLRPYKKFWTGFAVACLVFSITAPLVAAGNTLITTGGGHQNDDLGLMLSLAGILRAFAAPVLVAGFLVLTLLAPTGRARLLLLISAGAEILAELYVLVNFVVFRRFF
jgi:hypothetical protein